MVKIHCILLFLGIRLVAMVALDNPTQPTTKNHKE